LLQNGVTGFDDDDDEIKRIQSLRFVVSYEALEYFLKKLCEMIFYKDNS